MVSCSAERHPVLFLGLDGFGSGLQERTLVPACEVFKVSAYLGVLKEGRRAPPQQVKVSVTRMSLKSDSDTNPPLSRTQSCKVTLKRPDGSGPGTLSGKTATCYCALPIGRRRGWPDSEAKEKSQCRQGHLCCVYGGC